MRPSLTCPLSAIRAATNNQEVSIPDLMNWIFDRMRKQDVVVTVKAFILVHELMRAGSIRVMNYLATVPYLFHQRDIHPLPAADGLHQTFSKVILAYSKYLEEKLTTFRDVKVDYTKMPLDVIRPRLQYTDFSGNLKVDISCLQRQLDTLLSAKVPNEGGKLERAR
jgi:hypothetical protein